MAPARIGDTMDRRDFIRGTGAAAAAVASVATSTSSARADGLGAVKAPHIASATRNLRLGMPWPQTGRGASDSAHRLAQSIQSISDGRIRVSFAPAPQTLDAFQSAKIDMLHTSGRNFVALDPTFAIFAGLPGLHGLRPTYFNAWLASGGQTHWDALSATHGFKPLLAGHSGARAKLWSRRPLAGASDLHALRIACDALTAPIVRDLGAEPVILAPSELAAAFAAGTIDAVEGGGTISAFGNDLHEAATTCLRPGLARNGHSNVLAVSADVWHDLKASDQAVLTAAAVHEFNEVVAEQLSLARPLRGALAARHAITFAATPADIVNAAATAANRWVAESLSQSATVASYMAFRNKMPGPRRRSGAPPVA